MSKQFASAEGLPPKLALPVVLANVKRARDLGWLRDKSPSPLSATFSLQERINSANNRVSEGNIGLACRKLWEALKYLTEPDALVVGKHQTLIEGQLIGIIESLECRSG
jgi:hypothetical protein